MIKDLFNEIIRRMEWAKERKLLPRVRCTPGEIRCSIPIDESLNYVVSIREKEPGILIQTLFPDGEPHYYTKMSEPNLEEATAMVHAATIIVFGRVIRPS
jgi:hypothetical protein